MMDCPQLPAESGTRVPVARHRAHVCVAGHRITLGDDRVRKASAAGNRVAWIESRGSRVVIRVARVGRRVTPLRRIVRRRTPETQFYGVVLTRRGELAWLISSYDRRGEVALARPGRALRVLDRYAAVDLGLEDGRTLRWSDGTGYHEFFDLRHGRCPDRSNFKTVLQTDRVLLTQRKYPSTIVMRGCDLKTRRDVVIGEQESNIGFDGTLTVIGVDRTWVLLSYSDADRYSGDVSTQIATSNVATGERFLPHSLDGEPGPQAGAFAVTDRGIPVWLAGERLLAQIGYDFTELDRGGTIADLRSSGNTVTWTHDGAPRSATPAY